jgi:hypothetical protein
MFSSLTLTVDLVVDHSHKMFRQKKKREKDAHVSHFSPSGPNGWIIFFVTVLSLADLQAVIDADSLLI